MPACKPASLTVAAFGHPANPLALLLVPMFGAQQQPVLPRPPPPLLLPAFGLELELGGVLVAHAEGARGPLAGHVLENALVHQSLERSLEAPGIASHVVTHGGDGLLQGGQGYVGVCPLVCHNPQNHLGDAGLPVAFGAGMVVSLILSRESGRTGLPAGAQGSV